MAIVVSDTSPLRALAHLGRLDLLKAIYGEVLVPPSVADELQDPTSSFPPVAVAIIPGVRIQAPVDATAVARFRATLDPGESEALALAIETGAKIILIDEAMGRAAAEKIGVQPVGVLGVLLIGKRLGLVPAVLPLMERLKTELGFFISAKLFLAVKRLAAE